MTDELSNLVQRLRQVRRTLDRQAGEARSVALAGKRLQREMAELTHQVRLHEQVSALLAGIGEGRQVAAQRQIEALVTPGLQTIFGSDLTFHLVSSVRAKTPIVEFVVRSTIDETVVETDILNARGGGLAAIVGFLLRLVILLLSAGRADSVLFLDETFAHVSAEYEPRLAEFVRELVDKTGVQIIMVTHSTAFDEYADRRYRFTLANGVTSVHAV